MNKKRSNKRSFPAYRRSNNTFQIQNLGGALKTGQKVLISQRTNKPIIHYATGKEIGKVEVKLGVGTVVEDNGPKGTVMVRVGSKEQVCYSSKDNLKLLTKVASVVKSNQMGRIARVRGAVAPKAFRKKTSESYIAKIIE